MALLPLLISLIFLFLHKRKNRGSYSLPSYIYTMYALMFFTCFTLEIIGISTPVFQPSMQAVIYLSSMIIILFYGCFNYSEVKVNIILISNKHLYFWLEKLLIFGGLSAIAFFSPFATSQISGDILENRIQTSSGLSPLAEFGIINSIFSLFANMFIFSLLFFFLRLSTNGGWRNKFIAILNFISSLSFVVYVLAYTGRDGVVLWILSFFMVFFLTRKYMEATQIKRVLITFTLISAILIIPFLAISIARFSDSDHGILIQLLNYFGQQVKNFNDMFSVDSPVFISGIFPVVSDTLKNLGFEVWNGGQGDFDYYYLKQGVEPWVFSTFIGHFVQYLGIWWATFIVILIASSMRHLNAKTSRSGLLNISDLAILILLYQIILWGLFYFRLAVLNYYIIAVLLLSVAFKFSFGGHPIAFHKKIDG